MSFDDRHRIRISDHERSVREAPKRDRTAVVIGGLASGLGFFALVEFGDFVGGRVGPTPSLVLGDLVAVALAIAFAAAALGARFRVRKVLVLAALVILDGLLVVSILMRLDRATPWFPLVAILMTGVVTAWATAIRSYPDSLWADPDARRIIRGL